MFRTLRFYHSFFKFLSMPSARRATQPAPTAGLSERNFYPRPPRGGRPHPVLPAVGRSRYFYPRPPRGERLGAAPEEPEQKEISIHALREESDQYPCWRIPERRISIHALREESDKVVGALLPLSFNFYPRPPRGERPPASVHTAQQAIISIHALREESDPSSYFALYLVLYFYPRPPRGERRTPKS